MSLLTEKCTIHLWWSRSYLRVNWVNGCWWPVGKSPSWKCTKENCWLPKSSWKEPYVSKNWLWEALISDWFISTGTIWCNGKRPVILKIWFPDAIILPALFATGLRGREPNRAGNVLFGRLSVPVRSWDTSPMWIMWTLRSPPPPFMMIRETKLSAGCYALKILPRNWK